MRPREDNVQAEAAVAEAAVAEAAVAAGAGTDAQVQKVVAALMPLLSQLSQLLPELRRSRNHAPLHTPDIPGCVTGPEVCH
jgi:hypothetical protein